MQLRWKMNLMWTSGAELGIQDAADGLDDNAYVFMFSSENEHVMQSNVTGWLPTHVIIMN